MTRVSVRSLCYRRSAGSGGAPSIKLGRLVVYRCADVERGLVQVRCVPRLVLTPSRPENKTDAALNVAEFTLGVVLLNRDAAADRHRGLELMVRALDTWLSEQFFFMVPVTELLAARERVRRGDRDAGLAMMRQAVDELHQAGRPGFAVWGTGVLVETLLERGAEGDLGEAQEACDRLANLPATEGWVVFDIWLLRMRALLAQSRGDLASYRDYRDRYRAMATSLGFEGHMAWAEAMP